MKKYSLLTFILTLALAIGSCGGKDRKTATAIALADSTASLVAWSDAVQVLVDLDEIEGGNAKGQFQANDKLRGGIKQLREKVQAGFASKEALLKVDEVIEELRKAEADGLLGIKNPDAQKKFREITAFAQLSVRTVHNILKQLEPPPPPDPVKVGGNLEVPEGVRAQGSGLEKWTRFLIIGQDFAFAVIHHHRLDRDGAYSAEAELNEKLAALNSSRIAALP